MANDIHDKIILAHGGGGQLSDDLIGNKILTRLTNKTLEKLGDSASLSLDSTDICFTTDSYVVKPLFFNGGDIGKLSVCGTANDLAMAGARPLFLSLALIIETGLEMKTLEKILDSIATEARENNIQVATGDTKTVETGSADKIFINTAGIGIKIKTANLGMNRIKSGDKIIINGTIGDHGMTIISQRKGIEFESQLKTDCACLAPLSCKLLEEVEGVKFMRDPTRGGAAVALNDIAKGSGLNIEIDQQKIPVNRTVQAAADVLGFDVLNIANEGKFIAVVAPEDAQKALDICKAHPLGKDASIFGEVTDSDEAPIVEMKTEIGGRRIVQIPYGRQLPRIC
ncbi:MAG: hydrogenase expression/formation protein HypE [Planctomycetes bacterium]|nr:hydrogenase expression/formation protein HypE [Planctomycetota bacterium]